MASLCSVLFLAFALNTQADPSINFLAISLVAFGLTVGKQYTGAVCKNLYIDFLEVSFIINLGILSFATCYVNRGSIPVSQAAVAYT